MKFLLFALLAVLQTAVFALEPITMDPGRVLSYPVESWRDRRFEVFRWDRFPDILIFDTASYAVQDRLFKRLAFYVEKTGFRGRLARDSEIAHLHGWNAHDYQASDLAAFFEAARKSNFPLLAEERELEALLLATGILRRSAANEIIPGRGAVISLSRESDRISRELRPRFMAHEGFHGIYFVDEEFRNFTRQRWAVFPEQSKRFLLSFFDFQSYDISDTELVLKEFMAHLLQQPVAQIGWFFGEHQPNRMISASPGRAAALPERVETRADGRRFWPDLVRDFTAEAEVFSRYVNQRWGLAAGRVWN